MGNLAAMLKESGHTVTGSDQALYPPMSDRLREWKIDVGPFDRQRIFSEGRARADLYIVGNVISRGNVELEEVLDRNLPLTSMSAALYDFFLKGRRVQVIAGTHGKTTTSFLLHHILSHGGRRPGLFVGGIRADNHPGFALPEEELFVIEGDEYDTAFFDKGPKFLHYRPTDLILTHVEFDHADIYESFEAYKRAFRLLLRWIPSTGNVAAFAGSTGVREVMQALPAGRVLWYGTESDRPSEAEVGTPTEFHHFRREARTIFLEGIGQAEVDFIGLHNTANALGAALIAERLGLSRSQILEGLSTFPGVLRRQQIRRQVGTPTGTPIIFMEDFAHHPTAVQLTVEAARQAYPDYRIIGLFEPRSATSHRSTFQDEYARALASLDEAFLTEVFNPGKVAIEEKLDVEALVRTIEASGRVAHFAASPDQLFEKLQARLKSEVGVPTLILAMSNGGFGGIYARIDSLLDELQSG